MRKFYCYNAKDDGRVYVVNVEPTVSPYVTIHAEDFDDARVFCRLLFGHAPEAEMPKTPTPDTVAQYEVYPIVTHELEKRVYRDKGLKAVRQVLHQRFTNLMGWLDNYDSTESGDYLNVCESLLNVVSLAIVLLQEGEAGAEDDGISNRFKGIKIR